MRLVVGFLAVTLAGSVALADDAKPAEPPAEAPPAVTAAPLAKAPKVGLRVVRILAESNQALLFDKHRGTHVLAEVGSQIAGFTVASIDDDEVTLVGNGKELVLAAPQSGSAGRSLRQERAEPAIASVEPVLDATPGAAPADPYAAAASADAPVDPYGEPEVRSVSAPAPIIAGDGGVRVATAGEPAALDDDLAGSPSGGIASSPSTPGIAGAPRTGSPSAAPIVDGASRPASTQPRSTPAGLDPAFLPAGSPAGSPLGPTTASPASSADARDAAADAPSDPYADAPAPAAITPPITPTVLSRSELTKSLADFGALTSLLRGGFTPDGARLDVVAEGSIFAKAGLRAGDIVTAVDNVPLRSLDDAADLYVRASATRAANIHVLRAGKPLALRVLIH